jgi:hypothetical protein
MSRAVSLFLLGALVASIASAGSLVIVNPNFSAVVVQCSGDFAYQSSGGNCSSPSPEQDFNGEAGIGWIFSSYESGTDSTGAGLTGPNTVFDPPSLTGLPFSQAALLQNNLTGPISQTIAGFVPGGKYTLSFYLGSRYANGCCDGNQSVQATIDNQVIGTWNLTSFTPFTLETVSFTVAEGGSHTLAFAGLASGDHTAFFSGVSLGTPSPLVVYPPLGYAGSPVVASSAGFIPNETVNLVAYADTPVTIGTATADSSGTATVKGHLPPAPLGSCGLQLIGAQSAVVASGVVVVKPRLFVTPTTVMPGAVILVEGFSFMADEEVIVSWTNPQKSKAIFTEANGGFTLLFAVPSGAAAGTKTLSATGQRSGATVSAQIVVQ